MTWPEMGSTVCCDMLMLKCGRGTKGKGKGGMQKGGVTPMTPWPGLMAGGHLRRPHLGTSWHVRFGSARQREEQGQNKATGGHWV